MLAHFRDIAPVEKRSGVREGWEWAAKVSRKVKIVVSYIPDVFISTIEHLVKEKQNTNKAPTLNHS